MSRRKKKQQVGIKARSLYNTELFSSKTRNFSPHLIYSAKYLPVAPTSFSSDTSPHANKLHLYKFLGLNFHKAISNCISFYLPCLRHIREKPWLSQGADNPYNKT